MRATELFGGLFPSDMIPSRKILKVSENASRADADTVFVCIKGARANGHQFAADAYARGCRVFVAEQSLSLPADACVLYTDNTRRTLSSLACRLFGNPSHEMRLIGITGTKGKTTTAHLIRHILSRMGEPCGYIGTNGIAYADVELPTQNTTPDALTLQKTLRAMCDKGVRTAVIEVSSQSLMQYRADGTRFETVIFTNLYPDHIGGHEHPSFDHYRNCKRRLFTDFGARIAIGNADDPATREMLRNTCAAHTVLCSSNGDAEYRADAIEPYRTSEQLGISFTVAHGEAFANCKLPLMGRMNAENAVLAVAATVETFGYSLSSVAKALTDAHVAGRSEVIALSNGACAVIDYAHNGESLSQLLVSLREYAHDRLIVLFGSVGERTQTRRAELGEAAATYADLAILTSDNPAGEDPRAIIDQITKAFEGSSTPHVAIPDRAEAILYATEICRAGDILVLAGKGHENYQLIGNEKIPFSEKEILYSHMVAK